MSNRRYVPDLAGLMTECEANYARLVKLMPDMKQQSKRTFGVALKQQHPIRVCLEVIEKFKYTVTLRVSHQDEQGDWLTRPNLLVRIYHDARMAEVVEPETSRQLRGAYGYPNEKMYQPDEKIQRNRYLGEWLRHCLLNGYAVDELDFATAS